MKKNCFRFTLIESRFREIFRQTSVTDAFKGAGVSAGDGEVNLRGRVTDALNGRFQS
ncbi:MAG: hypothetical protein KME19_04680 [Microcoleus vaginatus WJT46-NPBG5]|nr:hypothetical protein [Microcoleus vaginatus WJT46-NPBG5]